MDNLWESHTMKLLRDELHDTMESVVGSSTISKVFVRNGGGPTSCKPSIGCGVTLEDEDDEPAVHVSVSSSLTITPSMPLICLLDLGSTFQ